ncbi:conserved Plasmodium protein, unknown function [Plasmodium vivax]|uniref:Uncharacterized protein n=1 Tax=Plasmodium vivax (strain Brazil I) TaxID=1033975 RepID=A0A0J9STM1_PLAV1|nr:hypothetical protein PVBG_02053 [Plasmodium vivax Brazil I]CAI7721913.1 conserved Plasmodium protein, unknown function [Plasmodium vivax]
MFIASYFDRRDRLHEKKERKVDSEEGKRSQIEKVLHNALHSYKGEKATIQKRDEQEEIKKILSEFLKRKLKKTKRRNTTKGFSQYYYQNGGSYRPAEASLNCVGDDSPDELSSDSEIEPTIKENKNLKHCAEKITLLSSFLKHDKLRGMDIQEVYRTIDTYIGESQLKIDQINEKLETDAETELRIGRENLSKLCSIKKELAKNKILQTATEGSSNAIEHMISEMKIIQKLAKQKEYIVILKNSLTKLDYAKKCAVSRNYDETLSIILDITRKFHSFKKNGKEQIAKGIQFFLPILTEYYMSRAQFLLSSISWGNNISSVLTNSLEQLLNDVADGDDEYSFRADQEFPFTAEEQPSENGKPKEYPPEENNSNTASGNYPSGDKASSLQEKIKSAVIFDSTYISLLQKESHEFVHTLISWNLMEKIDDYLKGEKSRGDHFSHHRCDCPMKFIDQMASCIITFFRSFFQNEKSPLFKIDKPEWGLKYLLYQCVISNKILKTFLRFFLEGDLNGSVVLGQALHDVFVRRGECINEGNFKKSDEHTDVHYGSRFSGDPPTAQGRSPPEGVPPPSGGPYFTTEDNQQDEDKVDAKRLYKKYSMMSNEQKERILYDVTHCEQVIRKLNFKIITECRLYILSRCAYFIQLYHVEENKSEIKKAFLNFIHHVLMLYKKWMLYDGVNCRHLLDDFLNNTFVRVLDVEGFAPEGEKKESSSGGSHDADVGIATSAATAEATSAAASAPTNAATPAGAHQSNQRSIQELLKARTEGPGEVKGVHMRNFFLLVEKEFLVDILKDMAANNCCVQLKNKIILEEADCVSEYVHIFTELLKRVTRRMALFHHAEGGAGTHQGSSAHEGRSTHQGSNPPRRDRFLEEYLHQVVKELLLIVKDEFRHHWNSISDLIGECSNTCLLYVSFCSINKFLTNYQYKNYLKETISSFHQLEKKMMSNFLDAFYHFISIRMYNLFSTNNIFHEYILTNLFKMKKCLPDDLFQNLCSKILQKLDSKILTFLMNQSSTYLHNECTFNTFISNASLILHHLDDLHMKGEGGDTYPMPRLKEIINLMTDDVDILKRRIQQLKSNYALLLNDQNKNWLVQVTKITNALLRDDDEEDSSDEYSPFRAHHGKDGANKACQISLKKIKALLLRRPDIRQVAQKSIVIQEFIQV